MSDPKCTLTWRALAACNALLLPGELGFVTLCMLSGEGMNWGFFAAWAAIGLTVNCCICAANHQEREEKADDEG